MVPNCVIKLTLTLFFLGIVFHSLAQSNYPTRDSIHIFWQPGITLTYGDFKGDTTGGKYKDSYKRVGLQVVAYVGIKSIVDVPKKKKDRREKLEKVYIAPAFDMTASYTLTRDPEQIAMQQLYFDIAETWARWGRQQLVKYQDTMKGYGALYIMYSTVIKDAKAGQQQMNDAYTKDVIIDKKAGSFDKWKKIVYDQLRETSSWATKPEDCYRFIVNKPIDVDYEQSPTVLGAIPDKAK